MPRAAAFNSASLVWLGLGDQRCKASSVDRTGLGMSGQSRPLPIGTAHSPAVAQSRLHTRCDLSNVITCSSTDALSSPVTTPSAAVSSAASRSAVASLHAPMALPCLEHFRQRAQSRVRRRPREKESIEFDRSCSVECA